MYLRRCYRVTATGLWSKAIARRGARGSAWWPISVKWMHNNPQVRWLSHSGIIFRDVEAQWVKVDLKRIAIERKRAFGGPWIGLEMCRQVGLIDFLERTSSSWTRRDCGLGVG